MEWFTPADERAAHEAGVLGDIARDAELFPDPERTELEREVREYGQAVIGEEWPAMANHHSSPHVWHTLDQMFESFSRIKAGTPREANIHAEMLDRLNELSDDRRLRLLSADYKVPPAMWSMLIAGGLIIITFSYFLGIQRRRSHALISGALAVMIGFTMYLIFALDHPFSGQLRVAPEAFEHVLNMDSMER
jgi:hypothetical protein